MDFMAVPRIQFMIRSVGYHTFKTIDVGKELPLSDSVRKVMKTFVIQAIHGDSQIARPVKWNSLKKKPTLRLSPDDDTVDCYCERANYLSYIQLHSEVYSHASPIEHGWMHVDRRCHSVRNRLTALPSNVKQPVVDMALVCHPMMKVMRLNVLARMTCF